MAEQHDEVWGYGAGTFTGLFAILPESVIARLDELEAVKGCTTWGEVADLGDDILEEVLGLAGHGTLEQYTAHLEITGSAPLPGVEADMAAEFDEDSEVPSPDDPFDIEELPAHSDGDWPPSPLCLMTDWVPDEIVEKFGTVYETIFNGTFTQFEAKDQEAILAMCAELGMTVCPSEALQNIMSW